MCLQLTLKALQLLAGGPDLPPENSRDLAPLVDGATRRSALRTLRGRDGELEDLLLLDGDVAPTTAPPHQGMGIAEKQGPLPSKRFEQRTAHRDLNRCTGVAHSL